MFENDTDHSFVILEVHVHDKKALHTAAMEHAIKVDGYKRQDAYASLGTKRDPDISACLQMLLDPGKSPPGTEIIQSSVE